MNPSLSGNAQKLLIAGCFLAVIGSFLPWWQHGDFISYVYYGVRIHLASGAVADNGGALVILLSLLVLWLAFRPPAALARPVVWQVYLSLALVVVAGFQTGRILLASFEAQGVPGAPQILYGLPLVVLGSMLLFGAALSQRQSQS